MKSQGLMGPTARWAAKAAKWLAASVALAGKEGLARRKGITDEAGKIEC
jgi:hypothetical protein